MELIFTESIYKEKIWGSETWMVSGHPNGATVIRNGKHKGKRLSEVYEDFPLLVKTIEAKEDLSIQVHPDDAYAKKHENSKGKTECWYVLKAKEDARLIIGHNAKNKEELINAVKRGNWNELLREVKVKEGDFFQIEPGTVHAIRSGVTLLEIQQCSDITYRLYDYDRLENGKKRELHIEQCLETIVCPYNEKNHIYEDGVLVSCPFYTVKKLKVDKETVIKSVNQKIIVSCVKGSGTADGESVSMGDSFVIPKLHCTRLKGNMEIILSCEKGIDLL